MRISKDELNELLRKEYERGRQAGLKENTQFFDEDEIKRSFIPDACKYCSNHPLNGGSGICHCTLGIAPVSYSVTSASIVEL